MIAARSAALAAAALATALVGGAASAQSPAPSTDDFLKSAAASDQFEILEGRVAEVEGRDPRVRAFAKRMIQEHTRTTGALQKAAARSGSPPPAALSGDQAMLLAALQGVSGPEFDQTYLRHQVLGHQSALVVERHYADAGADGEVRRTARETVPLIQHHLDAATSLRAALGG